MKTNEVKLWRKILISAWTLFGLGVFIICACLASVRIEDRSDNKRWYYEKTINDSLRLDKDYPDKEYARIYNLNTRRYVSPKMRWVSLGVSEGDSLTVFCDMEGRRGYINLHTGKIVIPGRYDHAWNFSEGLAAVCRDNRIGFINTAGEEIIPCQFPTSQHAIQRLGYAFHDGYCIVTNSKNECGLINQSGQLVVDTIYDCIWAPSACGARIFQDGGKYGLMDIDGTITLPLDHEFIYSYGEQLLAVDGGVMRQIDKYGNVLTTFCSDYDLRPMFLPSDYDQEHPTGYFKYYVYGCKGIINGEGQIVIPAIYNEINQLDEHLFEAQMGYDGPWRVIAVK